MIGRLSSVVLDCPDPHALARFYCEVLGVPITGVDGGWVDIGDATTGRISFQHAPDHVPPRWPDPRHPQQIHLDIRVDDIDEAEPKVLALGATLLSATEPRFRVYADPAGHPFCLEWE
ncbi:catechol 2,3-dioxygenase-like lactoylglutathione lyase family enzyme [Spinactinospora alkalitolerans]|uniref:Catechol 2,3-dioxygenase-like lactoylglutathione lyase family enzyme n=1 Tax=Spinactinospora alkalitolerans TaxID=687207 RepID=A0A852U6Z4_9ACTN|nr:VOC family protein [Spinactinospora alkalitolerans]NYE50643.1 catechol 2,3-dioxygenase-like lactoylglutathione lyase family enzyme [Spinactinospora alkalitolerans]